MDAHLIDSAIFGHLWSTPESRALFGERERVARWLLVLTALAEAQAAVGIIPPASAAAIAALRDREMPIDEIAAGTRETSHSTLGFIRVLRTMLPDDAAEHVFYGTTVQDITDNSQVLEIRRLGQLVWDDLWAVEHDLLALADLHRATPMAGRTHGQPGAPITFGFKVASWADEVGRQLQRLHEGRQRWLVAQLGGAVGTLAFFGADGIRLRAELSARLGLAEPDISWLTSRDRLAEFAHVVAMSVTTLARIANEVYVLQRRELGEVWEPTSATTVGSITMPHKRNPEVSEQVVTLARLVRAQASVLTDTMVQEHERDGRGWKTEWVALPELGHYATAATRLSRGLVASLEVDRESMERNMLAGGSASSEHLLSQMSARLGKHRAQATLQEAYRDAAASGLPVSATLAGIATPEELAEMNAVDVGCSGAMIDRVLATARRRRTGESAQWA